MPGSGRIDLAWLLLAYAPIYCIFNSVFEGGHNEDKSLIVYQRALDGISIPLQCKWLKGLCRMTQQDLTLEAAAATPRLSRLTIRTTSSRA